MKKEKSPRLLSATNKTFAQSKKQLKRWFLKNPNRLVIRIKTSDNKITTVDRKNIC